TAHAEKNKLYPNDMLKISGGKVVAGGNITNLRLDEVSYKDKKPEIQFLSLPGYGMEEFQFLIEGKGEITVNFESRKAKNVSASVKL
ncbi:MAG TPA: hypothetical protein VJ919_12185, partial [Tangfeifania sp.]|nr:hypothetical protein [Tangfeifania sp.]